MTAASISAVSRGAQRLEFRSQELGEGLGIMGCAGQKGHEQTSYG